MSPSPKKTGLNYQRSHQESTLSETNGLPLKMDGLKTLVSFWDGLFSGAFAVSFRECAGKLRFGTQSHGGLFGSEDFLEFNFWFIFR